MVNAIRGTGASNVILLGSLSWGGQGTRVRAVVMTNPADCTMMSYLPVDPDHQLALELHSYGGGQPGSSYCDTTTCLAVIKAAAAAAGLPVVADEIGDTTGDRRPTTTSFMTLGRPRTTSATSPGGLDPRQPGIMGPDSVSNTQRHLRTPPAAPVQPVPHATVRPR